MKNKNIASQLLLRFSPTAWAKLTFCRDINETEVGFFGITKKDDLLFVTDLAIIKQKVTAVSVKFDDEAIGNFFEDQVDAGNKPEQFARLWIHTHPGNSPQPSCTDEDTFKRAFGKCDWAIMAIVAQDNSTYARLHFSSGPGGSIKIPVRVDYDCEFSASDFETWKQQYKKNVIEDDIFNVSGKSKKTKGKKDAEIETSDGCDILDDIDMMDPMEREIFMEELAVRSEFWDEYETEVLYD